MTSSEERGRMLVIDGETVQFEIETANTVATGYIPQPRTHLICKVLDEQGDERRSGLLPAANVYEGSVSEQFTDEQLERLYREARSGGSE